YKVVIMCWAASLTCGSSARGRGIRVAVAGMRISSWIRVSLRLIAACGEIINDGIFLSSRCRDRTSMTGGGGDTDRAGGVSSADESASPLKADDR
ncbi:hypothetical protein OS493_034135, partial [Desmophyllum pertusum]